MSTDAIGYPVTFEFDPPARIARWRPFIHWLLVIPHFIVLYVLSIVATLLMVIAWFAGVITGKIPEGIQSFIALYLRYNTRVMTYATFLRAEYPPFLFDASLPEPGGDSRVKFDVFPALAGRSRLTIFFRYFMLIPQIFVLFFMIIAFYFVMTISWFAVVILGRWPEGLRKFVVGYIRWTVRVNAYASLLTDKYPPFRLS